MNAYADALCASLAAWGERLSHPTVTSVYFGGGTPSLFGSRLVTVLNAARRAFRVLPDAEITAECNPRSSSGDLFSVLLAGGFNRLSVGVQSFDNNELRLLGRRHTAEDAVATLREARTAGFDNVSLDLIIALPEQTEKQLAFSLERAVAENPAHLSVYLLKHEPHTPFASLAPMEDDTVAERYLFACDFLSSHGYAQYEISNFAKKGFEGRHNLTYWRCGEYLGVGASAHSFLNGKRFFYPRDIAAFLRGEEPTPDGVGGTEEEKLMLGLRLTEGIPFTETLRRRAAPYVKANLMREENGRLCFTPEGFLVSNAILAELL